MKKLVSVGDPIEHSLSPVMHNVAFKELGLDKEYNFERMLVKSHELNEFVESLKSREIFGRR